MDYVGIGGICDNFPVATAIPAEVFVFTFIDQLSPAIVNVNIKVHNLPLWVLGHKEIIIQTVISSRSDGIGQVYDEITFRAKVSKGTYIRVLGEDIAKRLDNVGHLISLRRTKVGPFSIDDAIDTLDVSETKLIDSYDVLSKIMPVVELNDKNAFRASHGVHFNSEIGKGHDTILMTDKNNLVIAIYKKRGEEYICQRGINDYGNNSIWIRW